MGGSARALYENYSHATMVQPCIEVILLHDQTFSFFPILVHTPHAAMPPSGVCEEEMARALYRSALNTLLVLPGPG